MRLRVTARNLERGRAHVGQRVRVRIRARVPHSPQRVTGRVRVTWLSPARAHQPRATVRVRLRKGRAVVRLPRIRHAGRYRLVVRHRGTDTLRRATTRLTLRAIPRHR